MRLGRGQFRRLVALLGALSASFARAAEPASSGEGTNHVIVYGGDSHFPPYESLDADGRPTGFNVELLRALARQGGVRLEIRLAPWPETLAAFDAGQADLVSLPYSEERAKRYALLAQTWTLNQV